MAPGCQQAEWTKHAECTFSRESRRALIVRPPRHFRRRRFTRLRKKTLRAYINPNKVQLSVQTLGRKLTSFRTLINPDPQPRD